MIVRESHLCPPSLDACLEVRSLHASDNFGVCKPLAFSVVTQLSDGSVTLEVTGGEYPEWVKVEERRSVPGGDPLVEVRLEGLRKYRRVRIEIPKGTSIESRFGWKHAILVEVYVLAP